MLHYGWHKTKELCMRKMKHRFFVFRSYRKKPDDDTPGLLACFKARFEHFNPSAVQLDLAGCFLLVAESPNR